jgi:hypothetical protein
MDVNYNRWMSKDPDAEPEIEVEPRRFRLPWPSRSAAATAAVVGLVVVGGAALVRSTVTPEVTADQAGSVETPTAEKTAAPDAARSDASASTEYASDSPEVSAPPGPALTVRRPPGPPPGELPREQPPMPERPPGLQRSLH